MDWNQRYHDRDTPWEKGRAAPPLIEYLQTRELSGRYLVPGCGLGHDARLLASKGCEVVGVDVAPLAIESARKHPDTAKSKARFQTGDFLDPEDPIFSQSFDALFEHTCFCAIAVKQRQQYVEAAARALPSGGLFLAILFTDLINENGPPFPTSRAEVRALFSPHFAIERCWRPKLCFPSREGEETMYEMRRK